MATKKKKPTAISDQQRSEIDKQLWKEGAFPYEIWDAEGNRFGVTPDGKRVPIPGPKADISKLTGTQAQQVLKKGRKPKVKKPKGQQ